ncbi:hypothetical protein RJ639_021083 [Escallonia herrerae]|uniref:Uncharacterized protein n=1 Tax=Escallonia herrerae TaxID=1293975 RepID=A0AA88V3D6_9ASTE|nr:hypothetical protein RJ639_021083 [Escallonia herrerae]
MEQFVQLNSYIDELRISNPGTTVDLQYGPIGLSQGEYMFQRIYICLGALKEGIKAGCRKLIWLDRCFMKSPNGGQLLTAVGIDPGNQMFPVVYAIVEAKNRDSWAKATDMVRWQHHMEEMAKIDKEAAAFKAAGFTRIALRVSLFTAAKATDMIGKIDTTPRTANIMH